MELHQIHDHAFQISLTPQLRVLLGGAHAPVVKKTSCVFVFCCCCCCFVFCCCFFLLLFHILFKKNYLLLFAFHGEKFKAHSPHVKLSKLLHCLGSRGSWFQCLIVLGKHELKCVTYHLFLV